MINHNQSLILKFVITFKYGTIQITFNKTEYLTLKIDVITQTMILINTKINLNLALGKVLSNRGEIPQIKVIDI